MTEICLKEPGLWGTPEQYRADRCGSLPFLVAFYCKKRGYVVKCIKRKCGKYIK